jgi:hypothetical protein
MFPSMQTKKWNYKLWYRQACYKLWHWHWVVPLQWLCRRHSYASLMQLRAQISLNFLYQLDYVLIFDMYFISLRMFCVASKLLGILSQNANVDVRKGELGFWDDIHAYQFMSFISLSVIWNSHKDQASKPLFGTKEVTFDDSCRLSKLIY